MLQVRRLAAEAVRLQRSPSRLGGGAQQQQEKRGAGGGSNRSPNWALCSMVLAQRAAALRSRTGLVPKAPITTHTSGGFCFCGAAFFPQVPLRCPSVPEHLCLSTACSWGSAANGRLGTGMFEDALFPELLPE